ncbi:DUF2339 domain-containing protein [Cognatilysobacter bugurensis]|uniref:Membrane protein n=1 Tax=Cognatilysobacter bugurensis TaxID=543356 RepID=A0A918WAP7_9GAMM|nr:DUF2339 domain-containing protein [Lysobacter bugurensis]GHA84566.1 membrane protein [Lysobacter bugurensis]
MEGLILLAALLMLAVPVAVVVALSMISTLRARVSTLESQVERLQSQSATAGVERGTAGARAAAPTPVPQATVQVPPAGAAAPDPDHIADTVFAARSLAPEQSAPEATARPEGAPPLSPPPMPRGPAPAAPPAPGSTQPPSPRRPNPLELAARAVRRWLTEGNVPVKVGVLVLFAGVAALLKHASDQGWLDTPIQLRLAGIAFAASAALAFGWRERHKRRGFGLAVQGGAIGVLLMVVFAAFKLYALIPAGVAFGLSVVLVAGLGVLAVRQDAIALAVFGVLAGFLAPIWLSTGQGNHVALFGYYLVLNAGILAIAWRRAWRVLNVLGFAFTFGIGTVWGVLQYRPEQFVTTQPFLAVFFVFYLLVPILYARRRAPGRRDLVDGGLVFGTPLVAFSLEAGLLDGARMPLAACALGLGALYAGLAALLQRRGHLSALAAPYAVLAVGFATLAVPLALSAHATASIFALEGAALVWLGLRQQRRLPQVSGLLLQAAAAVAFAVADARGAVPVANPAFIGALLIAIAGFASAWSYRRADVGPRALPYYLWGLAWWIGGAVGEISRFVVSEARPDALLALAAVTAALAGEWHRRAPARALAWTVAGGLVAAVLLAVAQTGAHVHPLRGYGPLAWALFAALSLRALQSLGIAVDRGASGSLPAVAAAHSAWTVAWALAATLSLAHVASTPRIGDGWAWALVGLPWLVAATLVLWRPAIVAFPLARHFDAWRAPLLRGLLAVLAIGWLHALRLSGDSAPLPWIAVLNPLDLAQLAALAIVVAALRGDALPGPWRERRAELLGLAGFALLSVIVLRATHHWGGVPWGSAMFGSGLVQTSLTVVWSLLGVLAWVGGARRGERRLWLAGAVLMAVVLAKLVLVDRTHLGNLLGIGSFIAYGLLCTAVGYFAPAPPRRESASLQGAPA